MYWWATMGPTDSLRMVLWLSGREAGGPSSSAGGHRAHVRRVLPGACLKMDKLPGGLPDLGEGVPKTIHYVYFCCHLAFFHHVPTVTVLYLQSCFDFWSGSGMPHRITSNNWCTCESGRPTSC